MASGEAGRQLGKNRDLFLLCVPATCPPGVARGPWLGECGAECTDATLGGRFVGRWLEVRGNGGRRGLEFFFLLVTFSD